MTARQLEYTVVAVILQAISTNFSWPNKQDQSTERYVGIVIIIVIIIKFQLNSLNRLNASSDIFKLNRFK